MIRKCYVIIAVLLSLHATAFASGFSIYEHNAKATGMAGAFIAQAYDPSAVFYNPAAMTGLEGLQINTGTTLIATEFAFQGPQRIDRRQYNKAEPGLFPPSTFYATYRLHPRLAIGMGVFSLFGLSSEWGGPTDQWVGEQLATKSELQTLYFNPAVAVKILDNLSLAAGVSAVWGDVDLQKKIYFAPRHVFGYSQLTASTTGLGYNVGLQFEPFDDLKIGMIYRSRVAMDFDDGTASFDFPSTGNPVIDAEIDALFPAETGGSSSLDLPSLFGIGVAYHFTERLTGEFDYTAFAWSSYDKLVITFDEPVAGETQSVDIKKYQDTYSLRFGMEYRFHPNMKLRTGYYWDRHAVPDKYVEPTLPEADRHNYTVGLGFHWRGISVDGAYHVLLQDDRNIEQSVNGFNGEYTGMANLFGLSVGYTF